MHIEYEIKYIEIDREKTIEKIQSVWWVQTLERTLMRRVIFFHPTDPASYLRVRDEWGKITTTYKCVADGVKTIDSVTEIECVVSDFDHMRDIYLAMWLREKAFQETYREVWKIDDEIECMIDEWPGISPIIEIEGESEGIVKKYSEILWFDYKNGFFWSIDEVYEIELGIPKDILNHHTPQILFADPPKKYV